MGETPAMFAAVNGKTETLKMLIMNDASLWAQSDCVSVEKRKTCLDWAVMNKREDTVKAILKHEDWKEVLNKISRLRAGKLLLMQYICNCISCYIFFHFVYVEF